MALLGLEAIKLKGKPVMLIFLCQKSEKLYDLQLFRSRTGKGNSFVHQRERKNYGGRFIILRTNDGILPLYPRNI